MSRLRMLNDTINSVASEEDANKLVKTWLPHHASGIDKGALGTKPGVRNCSLIAEFILTYINMGVVDYGKVMLGKPVAELKPPYDDLTSATGDGADAMHLSTMGHEMALVREGSLYGFYHAWEGKFHVFPRLNANKESFNVFGDGAGAVAELQKVLSKHCGRDGVDVRTGQSLRG